MRYRTRALSRALLAIACASALACSGGGTPSAPTGKGGGKGGGRGKRHEEKATAPPQQQPLPDVPAGEVRYTFISTVGKTPSEAAVLPLRYYEVFFPVMPIPPQVAPDYDRRLALRNLAIQMVEKKNTRFLNALHAAATKLDYKKDWQQSYEEFLKAGHAEGGWLAQLEAADKSGQPCPAGACGAGAPPADGCPHTHMGVAQWAPDGSLLSVFRQAMGEGAEAGLDTVMVDFGCQKH